MKSNNSPLPGAARNNIIVGLEPYLSEDFDRFNNAEILSTIRALEEFRRKYHDEDNLSQLLRLISDTIAALTIARGYATPKVPRSLEYYQSMSSVRRYSEQIRRLLGER